MNCRTTVLAMLATLALTACGGSEDDGKENEDGIYQLEMVRESDTCTPKRATGYFGQLLLDNETDHFYIFYPQNVEGDVLGSVHGTEVPKDRPVEAEHEAILDCPSARRWMSLELVNGLGPVEVRYKERYSNLASCEFTPENRYVGTPDGDCEASILLRYSLVQECASHCSVRYAVDPETHTGILTCECK